MRTRSLLHLGIALGFVLATFPSVASAQLLQRASGTVHTGSSSSSSSSGRGSSGGSSSSSGGGSSRFQSRFRYLPYPYAYGSAGFIAPLEPSAPVSTPVRFLGSLEGGYTIPGVGRGGVAARLLFSIYEFEVRYSLYVEPQAAETSEVALGRWDFGIHLLEAPGGQVRIHGGFLHWGDAVGHALGFSGGIGVESYPAEPFVFSLDAGGGSLDQAGILYARATAGVLVRNIELQVGWDHVTLTTRDGSPWVHLTGPLAGVRFWL